MIGAEKILAVIPARGGSKGVPRKNLRPLGGRPLIGWTIAAALDSRVLDRVILSSEDDEIMATSRALGCDVPFRRPPELARDDTPGIEPLLHACRAVSGYDWVVLLQPTSPLRTADDIDRCIEACVTAGADTATTVTAERHGMHLLHTVDRQGRLHPLLPDAAAIHRRQDAPEVVRLNGAVYVARVSRLLETRRLVDDATLGVRMPESRSVDIDTLDDFAYAEWRLTQEPRP